MSDRIDNATRRTGISFQVITEAIRRALFGASAPSADNPFVTRNELPAIAPEDLTVGETEAIHAGLNPSAVNPFITHSALSSNTTIIDGGTL